MSLAGNERIDMEVIGWAVLGALVGVPMFLAVAGLGMRMGKEAAVDLTCREGHFMAYGKRWAARELPPEMQGHVPPRPMPPPSTVRRECDASPRP